MNKGIRLATGDYLCFLNAGDELHEDDTLQLMVHSLTESTLPDVLYGDTAIVDEEGHFLHMRRLSPPENLNWKSFKEGMLVCHQAFFARRDLVEPYDLHYRFSADFDWCIRIMKKSKVLHHTHLILIDYLNEGMTTRNHKASLKERFHIMCKHYGVISTVMRHAWFVVRALKTRNVLFPMRKHFPQDVLSSQSNFPLFFFCFLQASTTATTIASNRIPSATKAIVSVTCSDFGSNVNSTTCFPAGTFIARRM